MENDVNNVILKKEDAAFGFKELWTLFVLNWHWFVISVFACVFIAGVYLWFTPTTKTIMGKMAIIDKSKKGGSLSAGLAMLNSLPLGLGSSLGGSAGIIDSEIELIMSKTLIRDVIKDLGLHTEYRLSRWGRKTLLYQDNPVSVTLDETHLQWIEKEYPLTTYQIELTITKDSQGYTVETTLVKNKEELDLPDQTFATLPATINTEVGTLTLKDNNLTEKQAQVYKDGYTLKVAIVPPAIAANDFINRLVVKTPSKNVLNILDITLKDQNLARGIDFVNHLVESYNEYANEAKNEEARKTDAFVNERLAKIDAELGSSDAAWESSKKNFQIAEPSANAQEVTTKKSLYESQLVEIGTQLQIHDYLNDYVNNPANLYEIIPAGISSVPTSGSTGSSGFSGSPGTTSLLTQHNTLVNQRKEFLKSMSEKAPQIQRLTESIQELHPTIVTALKRDRQQILMRQNTLQREYDKYMERVGSAPKMERVLTEIGRQREIKQGVYLLMLQKREETALELANTTDKGKIIDEATVVPGGISPKKSIVLVGALFLGVMLPVGVIFLFLTFKTSIDSCAELKIATKYPVLGEVSRSGSDDAIRALRTNLLLNLKADQKTVLVASNANGDGKTFIAQHLTDSLNAIGKKTFLIDGDLRKSSHGGHPADILASADFAQQVAKAKTDYDYIIFDSPALADYADAYQLAQFADATLFVAKAGSTDEAVITAVNDDKNLPNVMFTLNAVDTNSKKYKLNKK